MLSVDVSPEVKVAARAGRPLVEVAVDSVEAGQVASDLGADRLELCQALGLGGLTPSSGLMATMAKSVPLPVFAMIRPRPGSFVLGPGDLAVMLADVAKAREAGCVGVVVGALTGDGAIDLRALDALITAAEGMPVTFHRAFDACATAPVEAMAIIRAAGARRLLTSGRAPSAHEGRETIAALVREGAPAVLAGGGVVAETVVDLIRATGVGEIHLSGVIDTGPETGFGRSSAPNPARVERLIAALDLEFGRPAT